VDPVAVHQAGAGVGQETVPDLIGEARQRDPLELALASLIEQAQLDGLGVGGKQCEVDTAILAGGAQRPGTAFGELNGLVA